MLQEWLWRGGYQVGGGKSDAACSEAGSTMAAKGVEWLGMISASMWDGIRGHGKSRGYLELLG